MAAPEQLSHPGHAREGPLLPHGPPALRGILRRRAAACPAAGHPGGGGGPQQDLPHPQPGRLGPSPAPVAQPLRRRHRQEAELLPAGADGGGAEGAAARFVRADVSPGGLQRQLRGGGGDADRLAASRGAHPLGRRRRHHLQGGAVAHRQARALLPPWLRAEDPLGLHVEVLRLRLAALEGRGGHPLPLRGPVPLRGGRGVHVAAGHLAQGQDAVAAPAGLPHAPRGL